MFVLVLFSHIVGVLMLFATFALEWVALRELRRPSSAGAISSIDFARLLPRLYPAAGALIFLSGGYMATQLAVWRSGWIPVSLAALITLPIVGRMGGARMGVLARPAGGGAGSGDASRDRASAWLTASFRVRVAVVLGVVYLMVAKPDFAWSVVVITAAALVGAASSVRTGRTARRATAVRDLEDAGAYSAGTRQRA